MSIERFTNKQFTNLRNLGNNLDQMNRLRAVSRTREADKLFNELNEEAFEAYYDATREIVLEEGKVEISTDPEMVDVAIDLLEINNFPQKVKPFRKK